MYKAFPEITSKTLSHGNWRSSVNCKTQENCANRGKTRGIVSLILPVHRDLQVFYMKFQIFFPHMVLTEMISV